MKDNDDLTVFIEFWPSMKRVGWCGYWFLETNTRGLVAKFEPQNVLRSGAFHFINVYSIVCADKDSRLKEILRSEELISDGTPISAILKLISGRSVHVRGPEFMLQMIMHCDRKMRHYFLGSTQSNLDLLIAQLKETIPDVQIAGSFAPEKFEHPETEVDKWVGDIKNSKADLVWVGLGTPKQDFAVSLLAKLVPTNFIGVGAAFDFIAGSKTQAPKWVQTLAMEWLFRLAQEPARLWRRYLLGNLYFILKFSLPSAKSILYKQVEDHEVDLK